MNALFLAFSHLRWNWARSLVLILVGALILAEPLISEILLRGSEATLTRRAVSTPQVIGARGSQLDLVMDAVYFSEDRATPFTMAASESVWDSGLGLPIPLYTAFDSNGARIVGTTLDYFEFRQLEVLQGRATACSPCSVRPSSARHWRHASGLAWATPWSPPLRTSSIWMAPTPWK